MRERPLGKTDLKVSLIALGTMTWGEQNTPQEACAQLDYATDKGVTHIDTAEIYPFPVPSPKIGITESIVGEWLSTKDKSFRSQLVIASKAAGPCSFDIRKDIEQNRVRLDKPNILQACDESLKRLRCEVIDLYYLHWPERNSNFFGRRGFRHDPHADRDAVPLEESLAAMKDLLDAGKIRSVGISNESPWGTMRAASIAEGLGMRSELVAIQNPYSLLNRIFEVGQAEVSMREEIGLLAYAPLAGGVLSGKYLDGAQPAGARSTLYPQHTTRYHKPQAEVALKAYVALAKENGLEPASMAMAFVNEREFLTSNIMGATNLEQLKINIASEEIRLSEDILREIDNIHEIYNSPCP